MFQVVFMAAAMAAAGSAAFPTSAASQSQAGFPVGIQMAATETRSWHLIDVATQPGGSDQAPLEALRAHDQRVETIGYRLAVRNVELCPDPVWLAGFSVHTLSQYGAASREQAARLLGLGKEPVILAVAEGGPASQAGLKVGDKLLSLDGVPVRLPREEAKGSFDQARATLDMLERALADGRVDVILQRGGASRTIRLDAARGCPSRFQLATSNDLNARADGRYVQVTTRLAEYVRDDQELAAVLAHEFAHNIARHRIRLDEANVRRGFLGNFGRNARRIRDTEAEADRLSIYLLDRAGYDPEAAVRFWSRFGRKGLNIFGSPTHPNWRRRIALFQAEIALVRQARAAGTVAQPTFLPPLPPAQS